MYFKLWKCWNSFYEVHNYIHSNFLFFFDDDFKHALIWDFFFFIGIYCFFFSYFFAFSHSVLLNFRPRITKVRFKDRIFSIKVKDRNVSSFIFKAFFLFLNLIVNISLWIWILNIHKTGWKNMHPLWIYLSNVLKLCNFICNPSNSKSLSLVRFTHFTFIKCCCFFTFNSSLNSMNTKI